MGQVPLRLPDELGHEDETGDGDELLPPGEPERWRRAAIMAPTNTLNKAAFTPGQRPEPVPCQGKGQARQIGIEGGLGVIPGLERLAQDQLLRLVQVGGPGHEHVESAH
jgi:hypothetical protein